MYYTYRKRKCPSLFLFVVLLTTVLISFSRLHDTSVTKQSGIEITIGHHDRVIIIITVVDVV